MEASKKQAKREVFTRSRRRKLICACRKEKSQGSASAWDLCLEYTITCWLLVGLDVHGVLSRCRLVDLDVHDVQRRCRLVGLDVCWIVFCLLQVFCICMDLYFGMCQDSVGLEVSHINFDDVQGILTGLLKAPGPRCIQVRRSMSSTDHLWEHQNYAWETARSSGNTQRQVRPPASLAKEFQYDAHELWGYAA